MNASNFFDGMMGAIGPGMCRLSMDGGIAIKTSNGYKKYDIDTGRCVNCDSFVFDIGEDLFMVIPTNHVEKGDIILVGKKPHCVIEAKGNNQITVFCYEDSSIKEIVPERHLFMGEAYFYGKIVSMFNFFGKDGSKKTGKNNIMKYMLLKEMLGAQSNSSISAGFNMNNMLPLMMLSNGGLDNMFNFDGLFGNENENEEEKENKEE